VRVTPKLDGGRNKEARERDPGYKKRKKKGSEQEMIYEKTIRTMTFRASSSRKGKNVFTL